MKENSHHFVKTRTDNHFGRIAIECECNQDALSISHDQVNQLGVTELVSEQLP